ncbi:LOW QUALITY PROTEIN: E3 ubiquitin/ISG15 ligase TRIM25-like [Leptodactylus fuscus]
MASADLGDELLCSICLSIYTDPVTLRCGHNFCQVCIDQHLNTQDESGVYSCPECRAEFQERPVLVRNITLRNVVERVLSTEPHQEEITRICCTYCIHSPVPAVKSCLMCEASLCDNHLKVHSKAEEHVLIELNLENKTCAVHKEPLKYYCTKDEICICKSCRVVGEHRLHRVEMLDEASEKKKEKLRNVLQKLKNKTKETEERVQSLEEHWRKAQEKAYGEVEKVTAMFIDIRRPLDDLENRRRLDNLEKKVLSEISRQEELISLSLSDVIQKLEIKKAELSMKMRHIEELCNMTDPLTVLQDPDTGDLCDPEEGGGDEDTGGHDKTHDVDVDGITGMLHAGLSDIMTYVHTISPPKPEEMRPQPPSAPGGEPSIDNLVRKIISYWMCQNATECTKSGPLKLLQEEEIGETIYCEDIADQLRVSTMASADLGDELLCSICLSIYTDPITLRCGHNFCRVCIDQHLNTQDESGVYSCPECRAEFQERPVLVRNITLRNVAERVLSTERHQEEVTRICYTYCIHSPVPAVKSCLMCEASLCDNHLKVHSKAEEHVLIELNLENKTCAVHKEPLKYYCTKDEICICKSCRVVGEHRLHRVEMLDEASEKKKEKLRNVVQKLKNKTKETEERVQSLEEHWRKAQEKASGEVEKVTAMFMDIRRPLDDLEKRRRLDDLEKKVLSEISRQEEQRSLSLSALIQKLEIKKAELSMKMRHIEELCNMTDPLTVLQDPDTGDLCDPEEGGGDEDTGGHDKTHDVDVDGITGMLHAGLSDIMTYLQTISPAKPEEMRPQPPSARSLPSHTQDLPVSGTEYGGDGVIVRTGGVGGKVTAAGEGGIYGQGPADILLDVNTAGCYLLISNDKKTATKIGIRWNRPETAERFMGYKVMSIRGFTSGRHYWDVEIGNKRVGMCYPSIDRRGQQSDIGGNNKSWSLYEGRVCNIQYSVRHDSKDIQLPQQISSNRLRICLDYEAGQLSFYELCDPIRHLHTFTDTFTEPLHAVLYVCNGSIKILGGPTVRIQRPRRNPPRDW